MTRLLILGYATRERQQNSKHISIDIVACSNHYGEKKRWINECKQSWIIKDNNDEVWFIDEIQMANFECKRNPRQLSSKTSQLHRSVLESFNEHDRAKFTEILTRYQQNKNIGRLVESLQQICSTPQQREEIYPLMRSLIPSKDRDRFDCECSRPMSAYGRHYATYSRKHLPRYGYYTTRSLPNDMHHRQSRSSLGFERTRTPTPPRPRTPGPARERMESNARVVVLDREVEGESFGFCIRGGAEYNIGLFVSSIDAGSIAQDAGICLGDQILEVNRIDFRSISHHDAVKVIQEAPTLRMLVRSEGKIPASFKSSSSYRWTDPRGNEVSPPSQYANMMDGDKSEMRLLAADDERKVNLFVADGAEIGLKIRGGVEHGLGIFIASVERNSGADRAGIQVGDQILDVNGKSFLNISHEEAVRVLKSSQQLVIMLKDVGVLPHGKRVYDETRWIRDTETKHSSRSSSASNEDRKPRNMKKTPSFHDPMGSSQLTHHSVLDHSDEILQMKARELLPSDDLHAFAFYLAEYRAARLSLMSFLTVLSELLNTPQKSSLFRELRSAILPRDLAKYDGWIGQRELVMNENTSETKHDRLSLYSYKSSDSSITMNSWLGLFENGHEQRAKPNRRKQDALPDPPKDFFDDSFDTGRTSSEFGRRPRDSSFDLPHPPMFQSPPHQKAPQTHAGSNFAPRKSDLAARSLVDRTGHFCTGVDYKDTNEKFRSNDVYPHKHSTYDDDDDLYTPVDYKGPNRTSGNMVNKITMYNGDIEGDHDLYTSVDDTGLDRKHTGNDNSTKVPKSNTGTRNVHNTTNVNNGPESFLNSNGLCEEDDMPVYATVDKSSIVPKETESKVDKETEFEIPPPIPDSFFLETEDFQDSSENADAPYPELNTRVLTNNVPAKGKSNFVPSETGQINGINKNASDAVIETNVASFPERLQKFDAKSSGPKAVKNGVVQKLKKGKKKSKSNLSKTEEPIDYSQPFVVELSKHSSNLGLSVEGGTDTGSKEIRIKSIKDEDTVAGTCPLLKPGQIILRVDEKSLQNVTSGIAAMAIRQAFHSDKPELKLVIQNDG